jgi:16S rRNA (cytidine1402-2'-O)-methyltransferase
VKPNPSYDEPSGEARDSRASAGLRQSPRPLAPGLYVVATPIGNARDITLRALEVLKGADLVLAEDTRVTAKLFAIHGIRASLTVYNDHNAPRERPRILARLQKEARVALVSDAGTPLVSDPGYKLVHEALQAGIRVHVVPGPSAALVASGLPTDSFLFHGFLPVKSAARRRVLEDLRDIHVTLIFFESTRRLSGTLADMREVLGERTAAVVRELTKMHEETRSGALSELSRVYAPGNARGEATIIVQGAEDAGDATLAARATDDQINSLLTRAIAYMPLSEAVDILSSASGIKRKALYTRALGLKADAKR